MERYLLQLIQDLEHAACDLPEVYPYHIDHDLPDGAEWVAELAEAPYKTIAEWTGIDLDALPAEDSLTEVQLSRLVEAIQNLWTAFKWEFDMVDEIDDPVVFYRMFLDCWDDFVQYLPQSGFDVELCNGDPNGCRMGEDCICLHNPPDLDTEDLPEIDENGLNDEELPF